jgi:phosphoglycerate kinase
MSMKPVAAKLQQRLGRPVKVTCDCVGPEVERMLPASGEVLLLATLQRLF